jgi:hypothetical protein
MDKGDNYDEPREIKASRLAGPVLEEEHCWKIGNRQGYSLASSLHSYLGLLSSRSKTET